MKLIAGVDEVGRGPLAGPVMAAAVILPEQHDIVGITDSKKLSPRRREQLAAQIKVVSLAWAVGSASVAEIDRLNILQATLLAMQRAVQALKIEPSELLIDGISLPKLNYPMQAIIDGDAKFEVIAAASIIAKVTRDQLMTEYDQLYPGYGFAQHKGYGTAAHLHALEQLGATPLHRRSFAPVQRVLKLATCV